MAPRGQDIALSVALVVGRLSEVGFLNCSVLHFRVRFPSPGLLNSPACPSGVLFRLFSEVTNAPAAESVPCLCPPPKLRPAVIAIDEQKRTHTPDSRRFAQNKMPHR